MVLLHGWGSTSYMWRFVMPQLAARGYTVLAPDLRGLGDTAKPATGYGKATVAADIRTLVAKLGLGTRVNLVGHDMGGMVSYAYAAQNPDEVRSLAILDVPLPGIEPWDEVTRSPRTWHFRFYGVRDLPEMLIAGKERQFLCWFHNSEAVNSRAFTNEVEDVYARAYSTPGALRAGFELSSIPRRRESKCRIFETKALHARARHWRDWSLRSDHRRAPAPRRHQRSCS